MPDVHHEIEVKLDAERTFVLPDLTGLPGVARVEPQEPVTLTATYLDTEDLALLRHRTTLRRRTGGHDAGWHLKLAPDGDGRTEIHEPAGSSLRAVPATLTALVRAQLQGTEVAPIARITTTRQVHLLLDADGRTLAELADDHVLAQELGEAVTESGWREIEVELVGGERALLRRARKVLTRAGARPAGRASKLQRALVRRGGDVTGARTPVEPGDPAGAVAVHYLAEQLDALIAQDPRVRLDADDSVHRMRVATRRARAGLAAFRPLFAGSAGEELRAELKWLAGVLGAARDAEVIRAELLDQIAALPVELVLGPVRRRVDLELGEAYRTAHATVVRTLDGDRYLALIRSLHAFLADPPYGPQAAGKAGKVLRARVARAAARVTREASVAGTLEPGHERDLQLHAVRIAAKRARYAAEAATPVARKQARAVVSVMKQVQETLGHHQDAVVEREWLRDLGVRAHLNGENGFTFGLLHGRTIARAEHDEVEFAAAWAVARPRLASWPG